MARLDIAMFSNVSESVTYFDINYNYFVYIAVKYVFELRE